MHKLAKLAVAAGACVALTGCPKVKSVSGSVTGPRPIVTWGGIGTVHQQLRPGSTLNAGDFIRVEPGGSVTISVSGTDGKDCELTYTTSFTVVEPVDCSKQKEENEKKTQDDTQQQPENQGQEQASTSGINGPPMPGSPGIGAPAVVPTSVPDYYPGGGGGSAIGGPPVIATADLNYTPNTMLSTTTNLVEAIVGIVAVKKAGDKLDDNRNDKPVSP